MENKPYSVSLSFGEHLVHGHAQDTEFSEVLQKVLLERMSDHRSCALGMTAANPVMEVSDESDSSSVLSMVRQWREILYSEPAAPKFQECSVPDWMRPALHNIGMTDTEIDRIVITDIRPSFDEKGTRTIELATVTV